MTTPSRPAVIVICGPTGIGKTASAILLANTFCGRVLSADSMQLYRKLDIGTAKPTAAELAAAPHDMIDIADPDADFDAGKFAEQGRAIIERNFANGQPTIVAGGTGLYIKALLHGLFRSRPANPDTLKRLEAEADKHGSASLHERLSALDPHAAARIHPNDAFRVIRAMEVLESTGNRISDHQENHEFSDEPDYAVCKIGLSMERSALYERINRRVDLMMEAGLETEVRTLLEAGYSGSLKSMQSIGYRHMVDLIEGRTDRDETVRLLKRDTRRYAKRQFTWFNAQPDILWMRPDEVAGRIPDIRARILAAGGLL